MKKLRALALTLAFPSVVLAQTQVAQAAGVVKNELGMVTMKCQVVENVPGNPIVGFGIGNHPTDPHAAKSDANLYESKFNNAHKRHCYPQQKYRPSGAYDTSWNPK
ncbi:hypothetical protein [Corynebacterium sp.]|uniref:hypothetical protein n=1 Tax=Corynebacterium sp. TaxID=1720 RepID=UPI0026DD338E|nr:hypothetical protein [Corynebacterium sp.]MDO5032254.1 hypothetical protein [Corynebacterium sp.]